MSITRNSDGLTNINNEISVTVPKNRSFLGVLNEKNIFNDGDSFDEDGYVYQNGTRLRKWFTKIRDHKGYIWHPKLDDIVYCESKFHKISNYRDNWYKINWPTVFSNIPEKYYYFHNNSKNSGWKIIEKSKDGISTDWVNTNEVEEDKINQQAGDLYEIYNKKSRIVGDRYWMFYKVFLYSVEKAYWSKFNDTIKIINIVVNGRNYFIRNGNDGIEFMGLNDEILIERVN